ncbi:MAG: VRR-NUC domain-containing protein [Halieaceae bacterium]|nr:VRR-NUC domain-containing protein [Halieaceae bacterium]
MSLCDTVQTRYADLLQPQELGLLAALQRLDHQAQCLYVRLVSRLGPWFRVSKLDYPEIGEIAPVIDALAKEQLVCEPAGLSVEELAGLYTVAELRAAYSHLLQAPTPPGKDALLTAIYALVLDEDEHQTLVLGDSRERVIAPMGGEVVQLLQLLYFGNRHQNLTEFVLSDLGIARYYPYALDREQRFFSCREALDEYIDCCQLNDIYYELLELGEDEALLQLAGDLLERDVRFPSSQARWERLCNLVARQLERLHYWDLSLRLFGRSSTHPARERRARILAARKDWEGVVALCQEIATAPWCEAEREAAERILPRALRKLGGTPPRRGRETFCEFKLRLTPFHESVEQDAAHDLQREWKSVYYVENDLMNSLFGLAFWEQIFADVSGVFHNPYQSVPADMYLPEFSKRREKKIVERFAALHAGDLGQELLRVYRLYSRYKCNWTNWRRVSETLLITALQIIPPDHLLAIWRRQLFDPRENRSGFPDLIAFGDRPGAYCLIEVKGPGDKLQDNQKRWLRYFAQNKIPAKVAWVEWTNV